MSAAAGVFGYEASDSFGCRSLVEHCKLLSRFGQLVGQQVQILRLDERFFADAATGNAERKRAQCHRRDGLSTAKLLTMRTDANDIAGRAECYDLPAPIRKEPIEAHEA